MFDPPNISQSRRGDPPSPPPPAEETAPRGGASPPAPAGGTAAPLADSSLIAVAAATSSLLSSPVSLSRLPAVAGCLADSLSNPHALPDARTYADWLEDPENQRILAAHDDLHERRMRLIADEKLLKAMARLEAVLDKATNLDDPQHLTETRRAATTLGRLCMYIRNGPARTLRARAGAAPVCGAGFQPLV